MNILLVKYQYLEAQISGKFVKQKKVGEYLVFSLFSYRQQRPPPLSLSRTTTICFSANAALENLRISSFNFQIQTVPNSFLGRKKLLPFSSLPPPPPFHFPPPSSSYPPRTLVDRPPPSFWQKTGGLLLLYWLNYVFPQDTSMNGKQLLGHEKCWIKIILRCY